MDRARELIEKALAEGYLMHLATADDGGPWAAGVVYVHDDQYNLYWISDVKTRHSWEKRGKTLWSEDKILYKDHAWYQLMPAKIELIYQPEFDFDKQVLELQAR